jgi:hypothetical protein
MTSYFIFKPPLGLNGLTEYREEEKLRFLSWIWMSVLFGCLADIDRKLDNFPFSIHMVWLPVEVGRTKIPDVKHVGLSNAFIYFLACKEKGKTSSKKKIYGQTYKTLFRSSGLISTIFTIVCGACFHHYIFAHIMPAFSFC